MGRIDGETIGRKDAKVVKEGLWWLDGKGSLNKDST